MLGKARGQLMTVSEQRLSESRRPTWNARLDSACTRMVALIAESENDETRAVIAMKGDVVQIELYDDEGHAVRAPDLPRALLFQLLNDAVRGEAGERRGGK